MPVASIIFALNKRSEMIHELDEDWLSLHTGREKLPELELIAAVLDDAVWLIKGKPCKSLGRERLEAIRWVESSSVEAFSFNFCCVALNLHPQCARRAILSRKEAYDTKDAETGRSENGTGGKTGI